MQFLKIEIRMTNPKDENENEKWRWKWKMNMVCFICEKWCYLKKMAVLCVDSDWFLKIGRTRFSVVNDVSMINWV